MKFIENIEIKNFKSIHHQTIEGCKKINIFLGRPNVGKSNLVEAVSLFSVNQANFDLSSIVRFEKLPTFFYNGRIGEKCEVIINNQFRCLISDLKNLRLRIEYGIKKIEVNSLDQGQKFDKIKFFDLAEDNLIHSFFQNELQKDPINEVKKYEYRKGIKFEGGNYHSLRDPFGENIFSVISSKDILYKQVQELFSPYGLELLFDSREQKFTILKRTQTGIFSIPYDLVADTLQRIIFYKAAILSNKAAILLFEEPESHMFPPYIRIFTGDVMFDNDNQFFITTHSPYVFDALLEDAPNDLSVYLVDYQDGETKVKLLAQKDIEEIREYGIDMFFNIESYLKNGKINNA